MACRRTSRGLTRCLTCRPRTPKTTKPALWRSKIAIWLPPKRHLLRLRDWPMDYESICGMSRSPLIIEPLRLVGACPGHYELVRAAIKVFAKVDGGIC